MPSLSDRLKALGVKVGSQDLQPPRPANPYSIDRVLDGRVIETPLGETYAVETLYPEGYAQGAVPLRFSHPMDGVAAWMHDERIRNLQLHEFAFLDTETTGLSGGTGTYAFLIGAGRFIGDTFHLAQFFMRDPIEEPGQLAALEAFLAPCAALVTFNGKAFDVPLLNTRYLTHGWRPPFMDQAHIDLLHLARRLWRARLPSRTLPNLEVQILGATRTQDDVPGWMIPQMYFDYLKSGDARPLQSVFYHNAMDVLSLSALLNHTSELLANPLNTSIQHSLDLISLARLFEDQGEIDMAVQLYLKGLDAGLPEDVLPDALQHLAMIHKYRENLEEAIQFWEQAARLQHISAHIELAKVYEHRLRDLDSAIYWSETALALVKNPGFLANEKYSWQIELEHRLERLHRKRNAKPTTR
jgi:hypothetical protein